MRKIKHYEVKILKGKGNIFNILTKEIAAENDQWIVINDAHFEKITKTSTFEFCNCRLDKPRIYSRQNHTCLDNGIFYDLFTYRKKRTQTIRNEIQKFIDEKFGFLDSIDLNFIK